jgi:uncharacterized integral membrane protein
MTQNATTTDPEAVQPPPVPAPPDPIAAQDGQTADGRSRRHARERTRISGTWVGIVVAAVVLVMLLVFILQNTSSVRISYLGASGHIPLGIVLLLAVAAGVLLAAVVGSLRILQIRRRLGPATSAAPTPAPLPATVPAEALDPAVDAPSEGAGSAGQVSA